MRWLVLIALAASLLLLLPCHGIVYKDKLKCPTRLLKGGRVRMKSRGRVAKYVCLRGYQVLGDKYSTCIRGRWDTPLPVCISGGCLSIDVLHGQVLETYRGAFVTVHCDPGYSLVGTKSLYCNGSVWNDTLPICRETKVSAQKWCDFESEDLCGWTHDLNHDFDWRRHNFATPSGHAGTGPSFDHTFGPGLNGHYMYLETSSPRLQNDSARLFSPVFAAPKNTTSCFKFWYHMFGLSTGSLNVYIHSQDTVLLFSQSGDRGDHWHEAILPLPQINSSFQIVVEGMRGTGYEGDTAIDDVKLAEGEECMTITSTTSIEENTEVDDSSCENRCQITTADPTLCECTPDCINSNTCCPDYIQKCSSDSTVSVLASTDEPQQQESYTSSPSTTIYSNVSKILVRNTTKFQGNTNETLPLTTTESELLFPTSFSISYNKPKVVEETSSKQINQNTIAMIVTSHPFGIQTSTSTERTTFVSKIKTLATTINTDNKLLEITNNTTKQPMSSVEQLSTIEAKYPQTYVNLSQTTHTSPSVFLTTPNTMKLSTLKSTLKEPVTKKISGTTSKPVTTESTLPYHKKHNFSMSTKTPLFSFMSSPNDKIKLQFKTPAPPIIFRTSMKTSQKVTRYSQKNNVDEVVFSTSTLIPKVFRKSPKDTTKSKNDVLYHAWGKSTLSPLSSSSNLSYSFNSTIQLLLPVNVESSTLHINFHSNKSENKWKHKYKSRDIPPVHDKYAAFSDNQMVHILILVSGLLLILCTVLITVYVVRRQKINRRSLEDDDLDIRFLPSDEILDFTLGRPSPDDYQVCETVR